MPQVIAISGSPSTTSKSANILALATDLLERRGIASATFSVRDIPAVDLLHARFDSPAVRQLVTHIERGQAVIVASPVYKAAYPGVLKALLDLLPQKILAHKTVLPVVTGGSPAHLLAIDYAFKPVFGALGATRLLNGVYITDDQVLQTEAGHRPAATLAGEAQERLERGLDELAGSLLGVRPRHDGLGDAACAA